MARRKGLVGGFSGFFHDYSVAPLAIGVVIGTTVNDFVKTLVDGFFTPLISLLAPHQGLQNLQLTIHGDVFKIGAVINSLLSLLIILWIVYVSMRILFRYQSSEEKKEEKA